MICGGSLVFSPASPPAAAIQPAFGLFPDGRSLVVRPLDDWAFADWAFADWAFADRIFADGMFANWMRLAPTGPGYRAATAAQPTAGNRDNSTGDIDPGAPRLVGYVLAALGDDDIPWHRVVRADGSAAKGDGVVAASGMR